MPVAPKEPNIQGSLRGFAAVENWRSAPKPLWRPEYHPDGFNIGMNLGRSAGAGVADHLHLHVAPRWSGDANFVSIVGETRVLPEDLATTHQKLKRHFDA